MNINPKLTDFIECNRDAMLLYLDQKAKNEKSAIIKKIFFLRDFGFLDQLIKFIEASNLEELNEISHRMGIKEIDKFNDILKWKVEIWDPMLINGVQNSIKPLETRLLYYTYHRNWKDLLSETKNFEGYIKNKKVRRYVLIYACQSILDSGNGDFNTLKAYSLLARKSGLSKSLRDYLLAYWSISCKSAYLVSTLYAVAFEENDNELISFILDSNKVDLGFSNEIQCKAHEELITSSTSLRKEDKKRFKDFLFPLKSASAPRVAVCVSGIFRNPDMTIKSLNENILKTLGADVFVDTWDIQETWSGFCGSENMARVFGANKVKHLVDPLKKVKKFNEILPETSKVLAERVYHPLSEKELKSRICRLRKIHIESEKDFLSKDMERFRVRESLNQVKMFYKMENSFRLMMEYEKQKGFKYDFVLRVRPDLTFLSKVSLSQLNKIEEGTVLLESFTDFGIDDQFAIGRRDTMEIFCRLWSCIKEGGSISPFEKYEKFCGHQLYLLWVLKNKIRLEKANVKKSLSSATVSGVPDVTTVLLSDLRHISDVRMKKSIEDFFRELR